MEYSSDSSSADGHGSSFLSPAPSTAALHHADAEKTDPEAEGIALLREIFPDQPEEELRRLHTNRLQNSVKKKRGSSPLFTSNLGQRIWRQWEGESQREPSKVVLPDDFLRLPEQQVTFRSNNNHDRAGRWEDQLMNQLEQRVRQQHRQFREASGRAIAYPLEDEHCYTRAIPRDPQVGLGMSLCEEGGCIWVHSLLGKDGTRWFMAPPNTESGGPALGAGIQPGDWLLGIQGEALLPTNHKHFLKHAVSSVQYADDPVILHLRRVPLNRLHPLAGNGPSLLDTTIESLDTSFSEEADFPARTNRPSAHRIHPFATALASKGLIRNKKDEIEASKFLAQFTERARHWESTSSFRIDADTFELRPLFDPKDLPPSMTFDTFPFHYYEVQSIHAYAPSTPTLHPAVDTIPLEYLHVFDNRPVDVDEEDSLSESHKLLGFQANGDSQPASSQRKQTRAPYPGTRSKKVRPLPSLQASDVFIPLMGVRKALCVRILNTFLEEKRTAYTIWVYDVESGREWYAPIRYFRDFQELRSSTAPLGASISHIPFPSGGWLAFGVREKSEPESVRDAKCRQLENFLRILCTLVYTDPLHPDIAEISIHVQSFLGCDIGLAQGGDPLLHLQHHTAMNEPMWGQKVEADHSMHQMNLRLLLKRSIQRYTYRLFLLSVMKRVVDEFVTKVLAKGPRLNEIEALEAQGRCVLKERALQDLHRIQAFLDQLQDLILEGCANDFESIAQRRDFYAIHKFINGKKGDVYLDKIVREAVREQIEIEVYVPLRSVVSRLIVNGWRHDDMEIHFKMQELRRRPQSMFKIPESKRSPSGWRSVSTILNEGVGMSTLPCAKLRAIVDAAKEIIYVYSKEHENKPNVQEEDVLQQLAQNGSLDDGTHALRDSTLGADEFLPIFIYSVVQAQMERPCALCVLLQTLCDRTSRIGETGYYLASFEAAVTHIQELDLTKDRNEEVNFDPT